VSAALALLNDKRHGGGRQGEGEGGAVEQPPTWLAYGAGAGGLAKISSTAPARSEATTA
jgi:hypothetical protein